MKFSTKITLLVACIVIAISMTGAYFIYTSNVATLEDEIKGNLKNIAVLSIDRVDRIFYEKLLAIKLLADDPVLRSKTSAPADIAGRLKRFKELETSFVSVSYFDMNRVRLADTSGKDVGLAHPLVNYWKDMSVGKDFTMDVSESVSLMDAVFHFASLVKDANNRTKGVVVARMPLAALSEMISGVAGVKELSDRYEMELVDKNGLILYSNHNPAGRLKETSPDWGFISDFVKREGAVVGTSRHASDSRQHESEEEIAAFAREAGFKDFKGDGWTFLIDVPLDVAFAPAIKLRQEVLSILLALGAFELIAVYLFSIGITKPVERLSAAVAEVDKGNLDVSVDVSSRDEIGVLARAFNKMVSGLRDYREKITAYSSELETSRARLFEAQRIARIASWDWDMISDRMYCSDAISTVFELADSGFSPSYGALLDLLHPLDRERVKGVMDDAIQGGGQFHAECRSVIRGGTEIILQIKGSVLSGEGNRPIWMTGTLQDITEHKKLQKELLIFKRFTEASGQGLAMASVEGRIEYANPAFASLVGEESVDGVKGKGLFSYCRDEQRERLSNEILPAILKHGRWSGELVFVSLKGSPIHSIVSYFVIDGDAGGPAYIACIVTDIEERKRLEEELKALATTDRLTGAYNWVKIDEVMKREMVRARRHGAPLSVTMFDIDYFKNVNDTYGHAAGEAVLKAIADIVRRSIREIDYLFRWGGEEFLVVFPGAGVEGAAILAGRIRRAIELYDFEGAGGRITASFGVAEFMKGDAGEDAVIKRADMALYRAKATGKNKVEIKE